MSDKILKLRVLIWLIKDQIIFWRKEVLVKDADGIYCCSGMDCCCGGMTNKDYWENLK